MYTFNFYIGYLSINSLLTSKFKSKLTNSYTSARKLIFLKNGHNQ